MKKIISGLLLMLTVSCASATKEKNYMYFYTVSHRDIDKGCFAIDINAFLDKFTDREIKTYFERKLSGVDGREYLNYWPDAKTVQQVYETRDRCHKHYLIVRDNYWKGYDKINKKATYY